MVSFVLSPDERGTDVFATVRNPNPAAVYVWLRVRGTDITDRVVTNQRKRLPRSVQPGGPYSIQLHLDTTPLKSVTIEVDAVESAVEVAP